MTLVVTFQDLWFPSIIIDPVIGGYDWRWWRWDDECLLHTSRLIWHRFNDNDAHARFLLYVCAYSLYMNHWIMCSLVTLMTRRVFTVTQSVKTYLAGIKQNITIHWNKGWRRKGWDNNWPSLCSVHHCTQVRQYWFSIHWAITFIYVYILLYLHTYIYYEIH